MAEIQFFKAAPYKDLDGYARKDVIILYFVVNYELKKAILNLGDCAVEIELLEERFEIIDEGEVLVADSSTQELEASEELSDFEPMFTGLLKNYPSSLTFSFKVEGLYTIVSINFSAEYQNYEGDFGAQSLEGLKGKIFH